eukprot:TRINITY_DN1424_c0_g1_i1.p2 TRINITY_DN1424_c0_g1~~TRINITY_DN1424_c0_g1_i1.p2  ORF type:complete len:112 (+),score=18.08 TRINITY_DN1424_c0_g1_i1:49-384(+)
MPRHVLCCDLVDEAAAIAEYESLHAPGAARPEITASIRDAGVENMEIYRLGTRLVMIMDVSDAFSFDAKAASDAANPHVAEWEALVGGMQSNVPGETEKWSRAALIFKLGW